MDIIIDREKFLELLRTSFDAGWAGYKDLRDSFTEELVEDYLKSCRESVRKSALPRFGDRRSNNTFQVAYEHELNPPPLVVDEMTGLAGSGPSPSVYTTNWGPATDNVTVRNEGFYISNVAEIPDNPASDVLAESMEESDPNFLNGFAVDNVNNESRPVGLENSPFVEAEEPQPKRRRRRR